jgi:hypothetical protein
VSTVSHLAEDWHKWGLCLQKLFGILIFSSDIVTLLIFYSDIANLLIFCSDIVTLLIFYSDIANLLIFSIDPVTLLIFCNDIVTSLVIQQTYLSIRVIYKYWLETCPEVDKKERKKKKPLHLGFPCGPPPWY